MRLLGFTLIPLILLPTESSALVLLCHLRCLRILFHRNLRLLFRALAWTNSSKSFNSWLVHLVNQNAADPGETIEDDEGDPVKELREKGCRRPTGPIALLHLKLEPVFQMLPGSEH